MFTGSLYPEKMSLTICTDGMAIEAACLSVLSFHGPLRRLKPMKKRWNPLDIERVTSWLDASRSMSEGRVMSPSTSSSPF
ncbi:MAG: hypothetical protein XE01_0906 [Synergistales bacterium 58_81]|nr:MAG: hypothetical protein XE01_0906 [Synergistales bacterium 58_81]